MAALVMRVVNPSVAHANHEAPLKVLVEPEEYNNVRAIPSHRSERSMRAAATRRADRHGTNWHGKDLG